MNIANVRKGVIDDKPNRPKQDFNQETVSNFRKKMMEEEMKSETFDMKKSSKDVTLSVN